MQVCAEIIQGGTMKGFIKLTLLLSFLQLQISVRAQTLIENWGSLGERNSWAILNDSTTSPGNASLSGSLPMDNWATLIGGFGEPVQLTEKGITISGTLKIAGDDLDYWNPFRFGVFHFDSLGILENQYTDSASWSGSETNAHGYLFTPQSGSHGAIAGQGGNGNQWAINGGSWLSTWGEGTISTGQLEQSPKNGVISEGNYEFAISLQPVEDGNTEIRWYMIDEFHELYLIKGQTIEASATLSHLNAFAFGLNQSIPDSNQIQEIHLNEVTAQLGVIDLPNPEPPLLNYLDRWGFIPSYFGTESWELLPGNLVGDVSISGMAGTDPAIVAGSFGFEFQPTQEYGLQLSGEITFSGGGFSEPESFTLGLFNKPTIQIDSTLDHGFVFKEDEAPHSGYLITPGDASVYAIKDSIWHHVSTNTFKIGTGNSEGQPTSGTYAFSLGAQPVEEGMLVRYSLYKDNETFSSSAYVIDTTDSVTRSFNLVTFGISNSSTNSLILEAVLLNQSNLVSTEPIESDLPKQIILHQNYPNPFNPNTVISYQLPSSVLVRLTVFDALGREVATLVNGVQNSGQHSVNFDASELSSGVYLYRLETGSFVSTKKMLLMK